MADSAGSTSTSGFLAAYGHSWVAGSGATRRERCFVELAAAQLGLTPHNFGVAGCSTFDVVDLVTRGHSDQSERCLLMTGLNDSRLHGTSARTLESYGVALETIFRTFVLPEPRVMIIAVEQPHLLDYSWHPPYNRGSDEIIDRYNERLRHAASGHPRVVVAGVPDWDQRTMLDDDTVHPNDAGHAELARVVVAAARRQHGRSPGCWSPPWSRSHHR